MTITSTENQVIKQKKSNKDDKKIKNTGWSLIILVFVAGAASLSVEMDASRLLAPYFGTSLFVWANLIGLILLYLTVGYYVGGFLSDSYPNPMILYGITIAASVFIELIPLIAHPILNWALLLFINNGLGVFYGSLISALLLFAIPTILLGCVSPYAIRLRINQIGKTGSTSGLLYAISTAGSILGTFLPVLWLMPTIGVTATLTATATTLFLASCFGLLTILSTKPNDALTNHSNTAMPQEDHSVQLAETNYETESNALDPDNTVEESNGEALSTAYTQNDIADKATSEALSDPPIQDNTATDTDDETPAETHPEIQSEIAVETPDSPETGVE